MPATLPHPPVQGCLVTFPTPQILLLTLNQPKKRNCISLSTSAEIQRLWEWFDSEPNLQVAIITGTGESFCSGADIKGCDAIISDTIIPISLSNIRQNGISSTNKA